MGTHRQVDDPHHISLEQHRSKGDPDFILAYSIEGIATNSKIPLFRKLGMISMSVLFATTIENVTDTFSGFILITQQEH